MNEEERVKIQSLSIGDDIEYSDLVKNAGIVLYGHSQKGKVLEVIGCQVELIDGVQIVRNEQYYWLLKACEKQDRQEIDEIERIVGLTFTIICIQISNYLQAIVEAAFSRSLNHAQMTKSLIKLIFIRSIYKNKPHTIEIKYCEDTPKALSVIFQNNYLKTTPIKVFDLIQMFDCDHPENVAKVRQVYQKYESLRWKEEEVSKINEMMFNGSRQKGHIIQQLSALRLTSQNKNKLIWKLERLNLYKEWLQEQQQSSSVECSHFTFIDLHSKISHMSIAKYHKTWTANSLLSLKQSFHKISTKQDTISIKNFTSLYEGMKQNLDKMELEMENLPYCHAITIMKEELQNFYQYHHAIIKEDTLGFFKYIKAEMRYLWNYNNRIYKKIAAFVILMAFAYLQGNLIKAITVLSVALVVMALRC